MKIKVLFATLLGLTVQGICLSETPIEPGSKINFESCKIKLNDTIIYSPLDCGPFKIQIIIPNTKDSIVIAKISSKSVKAISDSNFNLTIYDTFEIKNDTALNNYGRWTGNKELFLDGEPCKKNLFQIKIETNGIEDSVNVYYNLCETGINRNRISKKPSKILINKTLISGRQIRGKPFSNKTNKIFEW